MKDLGVPQEPKCTKAPNDPNIKVYKDICAFMAAKDLNSQVPCPASATQVEFSQYAVDLIHDFSISNPDFRR